MAKKRKPGRPKLAKGKGQTADIHVRIDKKVKALLAKQAKLLGKSLSVYLRSLLTSAVDE